MNWFILGVSGLILIAVTPARAGVGTAPDEQFLLVRSEGVLSPSLRDYFQTRTKLTIHFGRLLESSLPTTAYENWGLWWETPDSVGRLKNTKALQFVAGAPLYQKKDLSIPSGSTYERNGIFSKGARLDYVLVKEERWTTKLSQQGRRVGHVLQTRRTFRVNRLENDIIDFGLGKNPMRFGWIPKNAYFTSEVLTPQLYLCQSDDEKCVPKIEQDQVVLDKK